MFPSFSSVGTVDLPDPPHCHSLTSARTAAVSRQGLCQLITQNMLEGAAQPYTLLQRVTSFAPTGRDYVSSTPTSGMARGDVDEHTDMSYISLDCPLCHQPTRVSQRRALWPHRRLELPQHQPKH